MAGRPKQKLKLLKLREILYSRTDEGHPMEIREILSSLEAEGISAERKSIYEDLETLREFGDDVVAVRLGNRTGYYIGERPLGLAELKLLVDAVQSSRFITEKKSRQIITALSGQLSCYEAREMARQLFVSGRIKSMNESIFYNVDALQTALREERKVVFRYFDWSVEKKKEYHRGGGLYEVSPLGLVWQEENYYFLALEDGAVNPRHFRVDKMEGITVTEAPSQGGNVRRTLDMARYTEATFGMFSGEPLAVELLVENSLAGVILDRFGREPVFRAAGADHFYVTVRAVPSPLFYGWALSFGRGVRVVSPQWVAEAIRAQAAEALE